MRPEAGRQLVLRPRNQPKSFFVNYDCIILLGSQPDLKTWRFPDQIYACVELAAKLVKEGAADKVVASGRWSRRIEDLKLPQPFVECDKLAELLVEAGVDQKAIIREGLSTDTISNIHNVKVQALIPNGWTRVVFVVADWRLPRLSYIAGQVLGPDYLTGYETVADDSDILAANEGRNIKEAKGLLGSMTPGDHAYLTDEFYKDFYGEIARRRG